jgi:serine/threonine protein kinase
MVDPSSRLQPNALFAGDYRVVRPLSEGGMGAVYVAEQISTGKQRALKLMLPQLVADPKLRSRFEQEAKIGARIESEHIVEVVGAGIDAQTGVPWLAMELLRGEDLSALVTRAGALPQSAVLEIIEQLCHAVGAAHAVGIVHRDLKPENIFIAESRRTGARYMVKVLDFGIAKVTAEAKTAHTAAVGSPMWMAPEQTGRAAVGTGADVWAIGLIVFHLLTGRYFWRAADDDGATIAHLLREIVLDPSPGAPARAAELGRAQLLPPGFDAWFTRSVDRDAAARFPNAAEQSVALATLLRAAPQSAGRPPAAPPPSAPSHAAPHQITQPTTPMPPISSKGLTVFEAPLGSVVHASTTGGVGVEEDDESETYVPPGITPPRDLAVAAVLVVLSIVGVVGGIKWLDGRESGTSSAPTESAAVAAKPSASNAASTGQSLSLEARGKQVFAQQECGVCHSVDGTRSSARTMYGFFGALEASADGGKIKVDGTDLRTSITAPTAAMVAAGMPRYTIKDDELDTLVAYLGSLGPSGATPASSGGLVAGKPNGADGNMSQEQLAAMANALSAQADGPQSGALPA